MQNAELGLPWMSDAAIPGLVVKVVEPDAGANPAHRTYVYLHGAGANEDDLLGLAHYIDPNARHIALRAPISYGDGWCWWRSLSPPSATRWWQARGSTAGTPSITPAPRSGTKKT